MVIFMEEYIRQLQKDLEKSNKQFRAIFENMVDAMYMVSLGGKILDVNPAAQILEGVTVENLVDEIFITKTILARDPENRKKIEQSIRYTEAGQFPQVELAFKHHDAQTHYFNVSISAYKTSHQHEGYLLIDCRDISESKHQQLNINRIASSLSKHTGSSFFEELALGLADISQREYVMIGAYNRDCMSKVTTIAYCVKGEIVENITYEIQGTPCQNVLDHGLCLYPDQVHELFSEDLFLAQENIRSYIGKPLIDSKGNSIGIIAILDSRPILDEGLDDIVSIFSSRAVTELERLNNDQRLHETQQKLALHVENTPLGVIQLDIQNRIVEWNNSAQQIFGYSKNEVLEQCSMDSVFSELDENKLGKLLNNQDKTRQSICHHTRKDRREIVCEWFVTPLIGNNDEELGYAALVVDITNEREMLSALQLKNQEQSEILNSMVDAVITIEETGQILSFNTAAEKLFSYTSKEIIGQNIKRLMPESIAEKHDSYLKRYLDTGHTKILGLTREIEGKRKSGETFPIRISIAKLPDNNSGKRRFIGACHDLTLLKQHELQIQHMGKMDALGKLSGGIAHDFNNLLGIITGYTSLLLELLIGEEKEQKYLKEIEHASERGRALTKKLLNISKTRSLKTEVTCLNYILQGMQLLLSSTMTSLIKIELNVDERENKVKLDPSSLEDAILNLCINAKHAMNGQGILSITTKAEVIVDADLAVLHDVKPGIYCLLTVSDTGCGIEKEEIGKVFDPFYSNKGEKGTGLGLSQVYSFMRYSDGFIDVQSELNEGSTFSLYFPQVSEPITEIDKAKDIECNCDLHGHETILAVDDEEALLQIFIEVLSKYGYKVIATTSPLDALEIIKNNDVSLLVSDVIMPEMDGFELADRAREVKPGLKIQLVSGFSARKQQKTSHDLNKNILNKPYKAHELLHRVRDILDGNSFEQCGNDA